MNDCAESDSKLAKWTVLRYIVLGGIIFYRVWIKKERSRSLVDWIPDFFRAGWKFTMSEGVGLVIYFAVSALMDNVTIFFEHETAYCGYVKMAALYSMSLVTFLPVCWFAYEFQGRLYDNGRLPSQILFILCMIVITSLSFILRLLLVFPLGWADIMQGFLDSLGTQLKIFVAVMVPPIVDGLQSGLLILSSYLASLYGAADTSTDQNAMGRPQTYPQYQARNGVLIPYGQQPPIYGQFQRPPSMPESKGLLSVCCA